MKIQILMSPSCSHGQQTAELVADVVRECAAGAEVETILVGTQEDAERLGFPGSPTVRVNGLDIDPQATGGVGLG